MFHLLSDDPDGPARCWASTGTLIRIAQAVRPHPLMILILIIRDQIGLCTHTTHLGAFIL